MALFNGPKSLNVSTPFLKIGTSIVLEKWANFTTLSSTVTLMIAE